MRIFPVKILVLMLALSLLNVGWARYPSGNNHSNVSIVIEKTSPSVMGEELSFFDINPLLSFAMGINIQVDFNLSPPLFELEPLPAPILPEESQNWVWTQTQSNCDLAESMPPMKYWFFEQSNCKPPKSEQLQVQAKPAKPEPPVAQSNPVKPTSKSVDSSDSNPHCDLKKQDVRWGHYRPFKHDSFSGNPSCTQQLIIPNKCVYYSGDMMGIDLILTEELKVLAKSKVEGYVLVAPPMGDVITIPVEIDMPKKRHKLIELANLDTSNFAEGNYQLAFVLTNLDSDPVNVNNWYHGLKGLISTARVKIRNGHQYDAEDTDGNGTIDCDLNGDGYCETSSNFHHRHGIRFFFGKPACKKGIIIPHPKKHVYYQGDNIGLYLDFPESLKIVAKGEADAYVLVAPPIGDFFVIPVQINEGEKLHKFFELAHLETSTFVKGDYQIGLVLTNQGGDPLNVNDWYLDFRGLVSITRIKISAGCDAEDVDGDGKIDGDEDNDGFSDKLIEEKPVEKEPAKTDDKPANETSKPATTPQPEKPVTLPPDLDFRGNHLEPRPGQKKPTVLPKPVDVPTTPPVSAPVTPAPVVPTTPPVSVPVTPKSVAPTTPPVSAPVTPKPVVPTTPPVNVPVIPEPVEPPVVSQPVNVPPVTIVQPVTPKPVETPVVSQPVNVPPVTIVQPVTPKPVETPVVSQPINIPITIVQPVTPKPVETPVVSQPINIPITIVQPVTPKPVETPVIAKPVEIPVTSQPILVETPVISQPVEQPITESDDNENFEDDNSEDDNSEDDSSKDKNSDDDNSEDDSSKDKNSDDDSSKDKNSDDDNSEDNTSKDKKSSKDDNYYYEDDNSDDDKSEDDTSKDKKSKDDNSEDDTSKKGKSKG
ncbi:hypothetical protein [Candidatus Parabeggiatoa sp. HSG14]|uniref:hypothetical protein n=1 Tax=Candidatus Parabeggiatoa sp. HSG14 TaxID=3055593 RepID=UPI0025A8ED50|nr:hypothetical protein [Thiotrichales bacterium HSG14]